MSLTPTSKHLLNTSRDGDSTTSPASLFHCLITLSVKKFFLLSSLNLLLHSLKLYSLRVLFSCFVVSYSNTGVRSWFYFTGTWFSWQKCLEDVRFDSSVVQEALCTQTTFLALICKLFFFKLNRESGWSFQVCESQFSFQWRKGG